MNIKFLDRFFAALTGLVILFLGLCLLILALGIFPFQVDQTVQGLLRGDFVPWQRIAAVGIGVALVGLGLHSLSLLFRRRRDRGFIIQHTEYGDMSISMSAMENMVKRCVEPHEELRVTHIRIYRNRDGVVVGIRISLANGVNIPLTVNALQKQIKHYITSCSGVDVKEVRVMVETGNQPAKNAEMLAPDMQAADACVAAQNAPPPESFAPVAQPVGFGEEKPGKEPFHQRIFRQEEPSEAVQKAQAAPEPEVFPQPGAAPEPEPQPEAWEAQPVAAHAEEGEPVEPEAREGQPQPFQEVPASDTLEDDEKENE